MITLILDMQSGSFPRLVERLKARKTADFGEKNKPRGNKNELWGGGNEKNGKDLRDITKELLGLDY